MKILIHPSYYTLTDYIKQLPEMFDKEGTTIYKARNEIKVFEVNGIKLNVKKYKVPYLFNRFAYTFLRQPKAVRAYEYALKLISKEINTPFPLAYILYYKNGLLSESYFISLQSPGYTLYEIGKSPLEGNESFFSALGQYTASLHQAGIYHRDYSPGNILYQKDNDAFRFTLIDINRMEFGPVSLEKGCANFARLWGEKDAIRLAVTAYAEALDVDPQEALMLAQKYRDRFWKRYGKKHPIPFNL